LKHLYRTNSVLRQSVGDPGGEDLGPIEDSPHVYVPGRSNSEVITRYRLERLLHGCDVRSITEAEAFTICCKVHKIIRQWKCDLVPPVSKTTLHYVRKCKEILKEETRIKYFGPISAFLRIKVNDPRVINIVKSIIFRYLSCMFVEKNEKETNNLLRHLILNSMGQQNWVFSFFEQQRLPVSDPEAKVYGSEADMLAAVSRKRAAEQANGDEPTNKKGKTAAKSTTADETTNKKAKTADKRSAEEATGDETTNEKENYTC
jgi:hypothetical protein